MIVPASSVLTDFALPLGIALGIGAALGLERELAHKPAGLRTQALITFGTTLFIIAVQSMRPEEVGRVAANVLTGLGFLGGGVILRERGNVRGLTTAALIWVNGARESRSGCIGACSQRSSRDHRAMCSQSQRMRNVSL